MICFHHNNNPTAIWIKSFQSLQVGYVNIKTTSKLGKISLNFLDFIVTKFVQFLAIYSNKNLPNIKNNLPELAQNFAKH